MKISSIVVSGVWSTIARMPLPNIAPLNAINNGHCATILTICDAVRYTFGTIDDTSRSIFSTNSQSGRRQLLS